MLNHVAPLIVRYSRNSPHMMAATLAALGRLTFELRDRPLLEGTIVQLFTTVLALLQHPAQEVVKAAISFIKVGLVALPAEAVRPLLSALVPMGSLSRSMSRVPAMA